MKGLFNEGLNKEGTNQACYMGAEKKGAQISINRIELLKGNKYAY